MFDKKYLIPIGCITFIISLCITFGVNGTVLEAVRHALSGESGTRFHEEHGWKHFGTGSNAGMVSFSETTSDVTSGILSGTFFIETVGMSRFASGANIIAPSGRVTDPWIAQGYAWNRNVGWIDLNGVIYNPLTQKFEGNAWNYLIGQIPMHIHLGNTPTSGGSGGSGALSKGFVGKVKIIGPLGGRKAYKNDIYNPDKSYDSIGMTKAINAIRKNIGLLKRNSTNTINAIGGPTTNIKNIGGALLYENTVGEIHPVVNYAGDIADAYKNNRSLIVIGGDVFINTNIEGLATSHAIIALKDDQGIGGNIYINGSVTRIESTLVTEGSIYSAEEQSDTSFQIYNNNKSIIVTGGLPDYQLYIKGSVISHNTIGGAAPVEHSTAQCPYNIGECTFDTAMKWDMNYFRDWKTTSENGRRGYKDSSLDQYSLIIENDINTISDPPPGLQQ